MRRELDTRTDLKSLWDAALLRGQKEKYIASKDLLTVAQIAITLGRPLLLRGEPGCGKTRFAYALADALDTTVSECIIKSTTRARDLLYTFDAVKRLYDAQIRRHLKAPKAYVKYGPLGEAIESTARSHAKRAVVLLDEVDKADIDFPNDLLHELDQLSFSIPESREKFSIPTDSPHLRPLVVMTHNEEKPLPAPFLRRCISYEIPFPDDSLLSEILLVHEHDLTSPFSKAAIEILWKLREPGLDLSRPPGLSEFLDWLDFAKCVEASEEDLYHLSYSEALLKTAQDRQKARKALASTEKPPK